MDEMNRRRKWDDTDGTPYGEYGDWCPYCASDWKAPHSEDCPRFQQCLFPPGCPRAAVPGRWLCRDHLESVSALLGPLESIPGRGVRS